MGTSRSEGSWADRVVVVLMAQDSSHVGCGPWPIGHYLLMTYLRGRQMVKYRRISGENPRSEWERASGGAGAQRYDVAEAAGW